MEGLLRNPWMCGDTATFDEFKDKYDCIMAESTRVKYYEPKYDVDYFQMG